MTTKFLKQPKKLALFCRRRNSSDFAKFMNQIGFFPGKSVIFSFGALFFLLFCSVIHAQTAATIQLSNLWQQFDGKEKQVTATTIPAGLRVSITYSEKATYPASESATLRINAGAYIVRARIVEPGFTGELLRDFTIAKINQGSLNISRPSARKLGAAPFQITAAPSIGLPISRWESSDPSVATVSSSGVVTIVGAGQTCLVAIQDGNVNYHSRREGVPLEVSLSDAPQPEQKKDLVFHGLAHQVNLADLPSGQASFVSYRNMNQAVSPSTPQVIFQNGPDVLDMSYPSLGFSATATWGLGKYLEFAGTARQLHSCDVTLVNWARYETTSASWLAANPQLVVAPKPGVSIPGDSGGFYHPITLSF
jgi:hypothetical protein